MTSVSPAVCTQASGGWTFLAPARPTDPINSGTYTIGRGTRCLALSEDTKTVGLEECPSPLTPRFGWFVYVFQPQPSSPKYVYVNNISLGLEDSSGEILYLTSVPSLCGSGILTYSPQAPKNSALSVVPTQSNAIFDPVCKTYFVPSDDKGSVGSSAQEDLGWIFSALQCRSPPTRAAGLYSISFLDKNKTRQYLKPSTVPAYKGFVLGSTPEFKLTECAFRYDPEATHTLSTGCGSQVLYLGQDPLTLLLGVLTEDLQKALRIDLGTNSILVGSGLGLVPSVSGGPARFYSCLSTLVESWTVESLQISAPDSIQSGDYVVKLRDQCLSFDSGNQKKAVLGSCGGAPTWTYDQNARTLRIKNPDPKKDLCLLNPSTSCSNLGPLVVGPCTDQSKSGRFILGSNGNMYDPLLGFCYTDSRNLGTFFGQGGAPSGYLFVVGLGVIVFVLVWALFYFRSRAR